jgi:hypothetical protein
MVKPKMMYIVINIFNTKTYCMKKVMLAIVMVLGVTSFALAQSPSTTTPPGPHHHYHHHHHPHPHHDMHHR